MPARTRGGGEARPSFTCLRSAAAALHDGAAAEPAASGMHDMSKGKSGTFRGPAGKGAPPAPAPAGRRPATPPPKMSVRPRGSAKGR